MAVLRYVCSGSFTRSEMYRDVVGPGNTAGLENEKCPLTAEHPVFAFVYVKMAFDVSLLNIEDVAQDHNHVEEHKNYLTNVPFLKIIHF